MVRRRSHRRAVDATSFDQARGRHVLGGAGHEAQPSLGGEQDSNEDVTDPEVG